MLKLLSTYYDTPRVHQGLPTNPLIHSIAAGSEYKFNKGVNHVMGMCRMIHTRLNYPFLIDGKV